MLKHFLPEEVEGLDPEFAKKLDFARELAGVPFIITSGKRTPAQNEVSGGVKDSAHLRGLAADISALDATTRFRVVKGMIMVGFRRIGIYTRHVHGDDDKSLPQDVIWFGESH